MIGSVRSCFLLPNARLKNLCYSRLFWAILAVILMGIIGAIGAFFLQWAGAKSLVQISNQTDVQAHVVLPFPSTLGPLAHYTEHLAWLPNIGKNSRPEDRDSNAWTNDYAVGYWLSGPPEDLTDMLRRLKVVFDPINLPQEFAETERDIADIAGYPVLRAGFTLINELRQQQRWQHERQLARSAERVAQYARQHAAIIAAIQARDAVAARVAMQAHLA